jgi:endonuclease IV
MKMRIAIIAACVGMLSLAGVQTILAQTAYAGAHTQGQIHAHPGSHHQMQRRACIKDICVTYSSVHTDPWAPIITQWCATCRNKMHWLWWIWIND